MEIILKHVYDTKFKVNNNTSNKGEKYIEINFSFSSYNE